MEFELPSMDLILCGERTVLRNHYRVSGTLLGMNEPNTTYLLNTPLYQVAQAVNIAIGRIWQGLDEDLHIRNLGPRTHLIGNYLATFSSSMMEVQEALSTLAIHSPSVSKERFSARLKEFEKDILTDAEQDDLNVLTACCLSIHEHEYMIREIKSLIDVAKSREIKETLTRLCNDIIYYRGVSPCVPEIDLYIGEVDDLCPLAFRGILDRIAHVAYQELDIKVFNEFHNQLDPLGRVWLNHLAAVRSPNEEISIDALRKLEQISPQLGIVASSLVFERSQNLKIQALRIFDRNPTAFSVK